MSKTFTGVVAALMTIVGCSNSDDTSIDDLAADVATASETVDSDAEAAAVPNQWGALPLPPPSDPSPEAFANYEACEAQRGRPDSRTMWADVGDEQTKADQQAIFDQWSEIYEACLEFPTLRALADELAEACVDNWVTFSEQEFNAEFGECMNAYGKFESIWNHTSLVWDGVTYEAYALDE